MFSTVMNFMTKWLTQCSDCFNYINFNNNNYFQLSNYHINICNLAKYCLHIKNKDDSICYQCFLKFFGYDRFIIRYLFYYLNEQQKQTNYIHIKQFHIFAELIINWHELINHIDFILLLFHIILSENESLNLNINSNETIHVYSLKNFIGHSDFLEKSSINSLLLYELIKDAFFFTAVQSNVQTNLTNSSQVSYFKIDRRNYARMKCTEKIMILFSFV